MAAAAAATANAALAKVNQLESTLNAKVFEAKIAVLTIQKRDFLEAQCKQFENNIKVSGLQYVIKDYHGKNTLQRREWRAEMAKRAFVETNVLAEDVLFATSANGKKELKRIPRDAHPLGKNNNATLIFAFTESWLANEIKERVRKSEGLQLSKPPAKRGREPEVIRINSHLPVIVECLRNECLKSRKTRISGSNGNKRYTCNESLKSPFITLYEIDGQQKTPLPFQVEDRRLVDPAQTLAVLALQGINVFKPFRLLTKDEKDDIERNIESDTVTPLLPMSVDQ